MNPFLYRTSTRLYTEEIFEVVKKVCTIMVIPGLTDPDMRPEDEKVKD